MSTIISCQDESGSLHSVGTGSDTLLLWWWIVGGAASAALIGVFIVIPFYGCLWLFNRIWQTMRLRIGGYQPCPNELASARSRKFAEYQDQGCR